MKDTNKARLLAALIVVSLLLAGCTYTEEVVEQDTETLTMIESVSNMESPYSDGQTSVTEEIAVKGEPFSLVCTYDTGDYALKDWRVTSYKNVNMSVQTSGLPEGYSVHIEHVHADISLKSTEPQIDGITQDSMDDSDHRVPTQGFPISDTVSYQNCFAIEGYTDQFYTLWGYAFGSYGSMSSSYQRLTESNIRNAGTYAEQLSVVYDIVITTPECEEGYVRSVSSKVLIPLTSEIKMVTRDILTGEVVENTEPAETETEASREGE